MDSIKFINIESSVMKKIPPARHDSDCVTSRNILRISFSLIVVKYSWKQHRLFLLNFLKASVKFMIHAP